MLQSSASRLDSTLLAQSHYSLIRDQASGELPLIDFDRLIAFSGFAPSAGADGIANYLVTRAREIGLTNVTVERLPSTIAPYCSAFRHEPYWEGNRGELWLVKPTLERVADFRVIRTSLGRNSRNASVTAELVDVGTGVTASDYEGCNVEGKLVLACGLPSDVMRLAVWERKALGVVFYRTFQSVDFPDQVGLVQLVPWVGPQGQLPTFAFSLSYRSGKTLRDRLEAGETLVMRAEVKAEVDSGQYPEVQGEIPGSDPSLPVVLLYAHDNSRNTGGANNLTGVGCTLEIARLLTSLITAGALPQPRRTIRFMWGAEHYGIHYHFHEHPDDINNILAMINIDMIGYNQQTSGAVLGLLRSPYSNPSFIDDIVQAFLEKIGESNTHSKRLGNALSLHPPHGFSDPIFAPTGSRAPLHYKVEGFWGPSDHEGAQALGLKAILLNDYPDAFISTQDDSTAAVDPTQMRRGVVLAASAAYFMAGASQNDLPKLLLNAATRAQRRMIDDQILACTHIDAATHHDLNQAYFEALNVIKQGRTREITSLNTLPLLVGLQTFQEQVSPFLKDLDLQQQQNKQRVDAYAESRAAQLHVTLNNELHRHKASESSSLIPVRTSSMRGPVNFFRMEYGRWWLIEKTGDEHFERRIALAQQGDYMTYEALNFANGERTLSEIRDALSAEFAPVSLIDVTQYFRFLEELGVVVLRTPAQAIGASLSG